MAKSINILFGKELKEMGYKKSTVNHFEKKYGDFIFCVDRDFAEVLLLRLMIVYKSNQWKCIESKYVKDFNMLSPTDFVYLLVETENNYKIILSQKH